MRNLYVVQCIAGKDVLGSVRKQVILKYAGNPEWTITKAVMRMWEVIEYKVISTQNKTNSVQA